MYNFVTASIFLFVGWLIKVKTNQTLLLYYIKNIFYQPFLMLLTSKSTFYFFLAEMSSS